MGERWSIAKVSVASAFLLLAGWAAADTAMGAARPAPRSEPTLAPIRALLNTPDDDISLERAKLTIDHVIDPTINNAAVERQLDHWAKVVRERMPAHPSIRTKVGTLLSTLYGKGPWNDSHPFRYDLNDPLGRDVHNKLLATYLKTREGNCTSMPILVAILAQKLGLTVALATGPQHMLVKFRDDQGQWLAIEATSGGVVNDSFYTRKLEMTPLALKNGIYLRALTPREAVGAMLEPLMASYGRRDPEMVTNVAALALEANPKDTAAMIYMADGYYDLFKQRYADRYPDPKNIPAAERLDATRLSQENPYWVNRAESLGWEPPTASDKAAYLQSIAREKARREGQK